jgi:hypothetical protein
MAKRHGAPGAEHSICAHGGEVRGASLSAVTVGVERVLYEAATDPAFRAALLRDRGAALAARDLALQPSERAVLANVTPGALAAMIDAIRVPEHKRRQFMKAVAAVSAGAAGMVLVPGCPVADKGVRPEQDAEVDLDADAPDGTVDASVLDDATPSFGIRPSPVPGDPER